MTKIRHDRRKYQRFAVKGGALAVLKPFPIKLGRILDISKGGLEIRYFEDEEWPDNFSAISILMASEQICLNDIPIKTIKDFEVDGVYTCSIEKRRRTMQFGQLTDEQREHLEIFIRKYTNAALEEEQDHQKKNGVGLKDQPFYFSSKSDSRPKFPLMAV